MVHAFATLGFLIAATGAAAVIWMMIADNRTAILAALGFEPQQAPRIAARTVRVRSVRPVSVPARAVALPSRRAA